MARPDLMESPPAFVVGSGRCGTSVMQLILEDHPAFCSTRFEPRLFLSPDIRKGIIPFFWSRGENSEAKRRALYNHLLSRFSFDSQALPPPNTRSNTRRGSASAGAGVFSLRQERLYW